MERQGWKVSINDFLILWWPQIVAPAIAIFGFIQTPESNERDENRFQTMAITLFCMQSIMPDNTTRFKLQAKRDPREEND